MNSDIRELRSIMERRKGRRDLLQKQLNDLKRRKRKLMAEIIISDKAQQIIHIVAKATQQDLQYHISDIVSFALSSVFDDPYAFVVEFVSRRNKIEADMWLEKNECYLDPMSSTGGGVVDIVAMALRLSMWTLSEPKTRPILILDEPFRFLKGKEYPVRGAEMIQQFSRKLDVQVIMNSHDPELVDCADKVIQVSHDGIKSIIR